MNDKYEALASYLEEPIGAAIEKAIHGFLKKKFKRVKIIETNYDGEAGMSGINTTFKIKSIIHFDEGQDKELNIGPVIFNIPIEVELWVAPLEEPEE